MVKYSDIIRNDVKDRQEAEKAGNSLHFSALKEFDTSSNSDTLPEQKDVEDIEQLYSTIVDYLGEVRKRVDNNERFDIRQAVDTVNHIINTPDLIEKFYQLTTLSSYNHNNEDYLITHLINVFIYSLKIGTGLKYPVEELLELGLAALLYDIGFFKIPETITGKKSKLTGTELNTVKKHTEIGKNILSQFNAEHPMLSRVAYEHHERKNGSGYPAGLKDEEICEYAIIIGLADTFGAMIHNRPHRKALAQYFSIKELVALKNSLFPSKYIKVFLDEMGVFPVGSYVRLNNMETGRVIANSKLHPLRPTVKMILNSRGEKLPEEPIIKLEGHPVLYVTAGVSKEDLSKE
ncbi:MAG: HD domain-containing phosphohydrolase, partial [Desulfobacterales bacterium]|nr:HD domain-containing phosphohydrolase [Desulfobacterales bacterium]